MSPRPAKIVLSYLCAVDAKSRRRILYHGTSPEAGRRIMSEGLVPDPKKRSWAEDPGVGYHMTPRTSFTGIYLTGNLMTAYSSATRTAGPHEEHIIVVVDIEEATLVHDEDTLRGPLEMAMQGLVPKGLILTERGALELYDAMSRGDLDTQLKEAAKSFLKAYDIPFQKGYGKERLPVVEGALRAFVARQASYALPSITWFAREKTWEQMRDENASNHEWNLKDLPAPKEADRLFMGALERLSDKLKPAQAAGFVADRFMDTSRLRTPIGFSGSNKIVALIGVNHDRGADSPYIVKFKYGNPNDQRLRDFFKQFEERFTDKYIVQDGSGKAVNEPLRSEVFEGVRHV